MSYAVGRALVLNTVVLVLGWIVSGCSGAVGTSGQAESAAIDEGRTKSADSG